MKKKRILALGLSLALVCGVLPAPTLAAEEKNIPFVDLQDPQVAEAAEFLRLLGVVDGTGENAFTPDRVLTRAEFCKMAVELMGNGDKVPAQMNRTVFLDVSSTHWARGYINVATQTSTEGDNTTPGIIRGDATGRFHPDDFITCAEAVTILMRVLGYSDGTVGFGANWYDGYMSTADSVGLMDELSLQPADTMTRGETARLLYNLYFTEKKGSKDTYLVSRGGKEVEGGVVLDVDATAQDGTKGAFQTTVDTYKTDRIFDPALEGREGKVILDADGKLLSFRPKEGTSEKLVNILSTEATYLMASGGEKITVEPETKVYREGKESTWEKTWADITSATPVTFHYGADGKLSYLYFTSVSEEGTESMVARVAPNGANPFASMAGGGSYTMFKNGMAATASDIRQYDVATWDKGTRVIQVSDLKLTGVYENASPSPAAPVSIKVMGMEFKILSSARDDIEAFRVGEKITLLLTADNQVAGVVSADTVKGNAVGVASVSENGSATVKLFQSGLEVTGKVSASSASRYDNQLVSVNGSAVGRLSLSLITNSDVKGSLNVAERTLGDRGIAENVVIYDRVKDGQAVRVSYDDLAAETLPKSKISFAAYDYMGRVNYLVLNDATGDAYEYGYLKSKKEQIPVSNLAGGADSYEKITVWVEQGNAEQNQVKVNEAKALIGVQNNVPGGIAVDAKGNMAASVVLRSLTKVGRAAFDTEDMTVTVAGVSYPISNQVQCYNKTTETWFKPGKEGVEAIRAYSDDLTLYYDRDPNEGGKIRLIEVS